MNRLFRISLRQGSGSVANFSIEFRILAAECGWDEPALMTLFAMNLSEELKDELASRDDSTCLEQMIALAVRIDNRLRERSRNEPTGPVAQPHQRVPVLESLPPRLGVLSGLLPPHLPQKNPCIWVELAYLPQNVSDGCN